jgi:hypothetical protein
MLTCLHAQPTTSVSTHQHDCWPCAHTQHASSRILQNQAHQPACFVNQFQPVLYPRGQVYLQLGVPSSGPPLQPGSVITRPTGDVRGNGAYAVHAIPAGTHIADYEGELLDNDAFFSRYPDGVVSGDCWLAACAACMLAVLQQLVGIPRGLCCNSCSGPGSIGSHRHACCAAAAGWCTEGSLLQPLQLTFAGFIGSHRQCVSTPPLAMSGAAQRHVHQPLAVLLMHLAGCWHWLNSCNIGASLI